MRNKRIFLSPPHLGDNELSFVREAFKSNYIAPLGPMVDAFEREFSEYAGIKYCIALSSGTAATHLALKKIDICPGDEVVTSTLTFIGGVTPITFEHATPVFIDSDKFSWNMDPILLKNELGACMENGKLPKAVITTDLYGQCADYERIYSICKKYDIPVIVDAAEAVGSRYNSATRPVTSEFWDHSGKGATAAVFSFNGNKIITTSGGGMLASDNKELIEYARFLSQQARDPYPHYEHSEFGYNYRMSNILAAIGRGQLQVVEKRVKRKREIFNYYQEAIGDLTGIEFMPEPYYSKSNRWLTVILITPEEFGYDRETVRIALEGENIESRPVWKPMHLQPVFDCGLDIDKNKHAQTGKKRYKARIVGGEVAEDLYDRGLCLPSGTAMTNSDIDRVVKIIRQFKK